MPYYALCFTHSFSATVCLAFLFYHPDVVITVYMLSSYATNFSPVDHRCFVALTAGVSRFLTGEKSIKRGYWRLSFLLYVINGRRVYQKVSF